MYKFRITKKRLWSWGGDWQTNMDETLDWTGGGVKDRPGLSWGSGVGVT